MTAMATTSAATRVDYTHIDVLGWIGQVRAIVMQDRLMARLSYYDRFFISGMAQGLPEVSWCVASAELVELAQLPGSPGARRLERRVPCSHCEVGLVAFDGHLLCPRDQPETLVARLLEKAMADQMAELDNTWDPIRYRLANVEVKCVNRDAVFPGVFAPAGLMAPSTHIATLFREHRARHEEFGRLDQATPTVSVPTTLRRI